MAAPTVRSLSMSGEVWATEAAAKRLSRCGCWARGRSVRRPGDEDGLWRVGLKRDKCCASHGKQQQTWEVEAQHGDAADGR
jgi:hypothetical protein